MPTYSNLPLPGEEEAINKLIRLLEDKMTREIPESGMMKRDAHPKMIALVQAEFTIEPNLPKELRVGVFKEERSFPAWVRFSNQSAPPSPDKVRDIRGIAIKLMKVEGELKIKNTNTFRTNDFILISTSYFVTKNIIEFAGLISALISGKMKMGVYFLFHPKVLWNLLSSNKRFGSLLEARFWSVSPYRFGDRVVKYSVRPTTTKQTPIPKEPSDNYLTETMAQQLNSNSYSFDFMIQFQTNPEKMPIEDLSVAWDEVASPFVKVATLNIPIQQFDTPEQQAYGDQLSFTPWHCLPEHTPLGGINRGRKIIYDTISKFRHNANKLERFEPFDFTISNL